MSVFPLADEVYVATTVSLLSDFCVLPELVLLSDVESLLFTVTLLSLFPVVVAAASASLSELSFSDELLSSVLLVFAVVEVVVVVVMVSLSELSSLLEVSEILLSIVTACVLSLDEASLISVLFAQPVASIQTASAIITEFILMLFFIIFTAFRFLSCNHYIAINLN